MINRQRGVRVALMQYEVSLQAMLHGQAEFPAVWGCLERADLIMGGLDFATDIM